MRGAIKQKYWMNISSFTNSINHSLQSYVCGPWVRRWPYPGSDASNAVLDNRMHMAGTSLFTFNLKIHLILKSYSWHTHLIIQFKIISLKSRYNDCVNRNSDTTTKRNVFYYDVAIYFVYCGNTTFLILLFWAPSILQFYKMKFYI